MISRAGMGLPALLVLAPACLILATTRGPAPAAASAQIPTPPVFQWDRFEPAGLGISLLKPTTLKLLPLKVTPRGFSVFAGREPQTGTRLTLYVTRTLRAQDDLEKDLQALTGRPAKDWVPLLARGPRQGFAWQRGLYRESKTRMTQSALLMTHASKPLSYIVLVEVALATATRNLRLFTKAYEGMRSLP